LKRRVVITGMAGLTSLGHTWSEIKTRMKAGETGTRYIEEWDKLSDLSIKVGAPVDTFSEVGLYPRQMMRSLGRVSAMAVKSAERALEHAGLLDDPVLRTGRVGVACGSSYGSTAPTREFVRFMETGKSGTLNGTSYIRMMAHTTAVNISVFFGLQGRVITTSSACVSGSQGVGYAFEAIQDGRADIMVAGGAEEFCPTMAMVFDRVYATSQSNDSPATASRPFDATRDGLVTGEGAGMLILEALEHAQARGARPLAEIVGFATNADGAHISHPDADTQAVVMQQAMANAGIGPKDIDFINGHGTATVAGDISESHSTLMAYGDRAAFSTTKGHFGHTLGACGAVEIWLSVEMMNDGWVAPIANLSAVDPKCAPLDYVTGSGRTANITQFASNNFAFGGLNTSLIVRRL
jgi:3-oxoacyl-[acyl-carrier-protein] synthase II